MTQLLPGLWWQSSQSCIWLHLIPESMPKLPRRLNNALRLADLSVSNIILPFSKAYMVEVTAIM